MKESERIREILAGLTPDTRLFRINSGMGWVGKVKRLKSGDIIIHDPRPLHAAPEGWPDLCGWTEVEITADMVGQKVAVFTGVEVKVTGKLRPKQVAFRDIITRMGGVFRVER